METNTDFTQEEAQKMYEILCDIRQTLNEQATISGRENIPMYQLAWLLGVEELLGRIELSRLLGKTKHGEA